MLISIITPCLNRAGFIEDAVESVRKQNHPDVEHVIMDGGSTDGTVEILSRYPDVRLSSQPDDGIYDALNKGLPLSHGEVIGFLNTDDLYEPDIFAMVASAFSDHPQADAVVGGASIFTGSSDVMEFPPVPPDHLLSRATVGAPIFNAWFFRRTLLEQMGGFDLRYLYTADRDLLIRMAFRDTTYVSIDRAFYRYRMHPGSFTLSGEESGEADFMFEARDLAENYLRMKTLDRADRATFKAWHSQIMLEQILTAIHAKAFHRAAGYLLVGLRRNAGLSVIFGGEVRRRLAARAGSTFGT